MKFATYRNGRRDGRLMIVSRQLRRAVDAGAAATMQQALEQWDAVAPALQAQADALEAGRATDAVDFEPARCMAPLPRTHQFVDASAFLNHGDILEQAFKLTVTKMPGIPILVQRQADDFMGPLDDYPFPDEADNADFEGEFGVVVDDTPMGADAAACAARIRLLTLFNDVSMRGHLSRELQMGFGFINAKPATVFAPVAVTPDELGPAWADGRVQLDLQVSRNGQPFGHPNGREMDWSFGQILAHLAYNRRLRAGTLVGSGTVSNRGYRAVGSACLAEQRAVEVIDHGEPRSPFLRFGDRLRFEVIGLDGQSVFGAIDHRFVPSGTRRFAAP